MANAITKPIAMKLAEVQKQLHAPKSQENKFGGYKYRSCEDILQAVKPLLGEMVIVITDEIVMVADRIYVKATATLTDGESSISTSAFAREALTKKGQDESQITGSASSYARKYALNGLLLIDDNKDADSQDNRTSGHPINKQQLNKLEAVLNSCSPKVQAKFEKDYPDATKIMADAFDSLIFALEGAARKYQDHLSQQNAA